VSAYEEFRALGDARGEQIPEGLCAEASKELESAVMAALERLYGGAIPFKIIRSQRAAEVFFTFRASTSGTPGWHEITEEIPPLVIIAKSLYLNCTKEFPPLNRLAPALAGQIAVLAAFGDRFVIRVACELSAQTRHETKTVEKRLRCRWGWEQSKSLVFSGGME
jgi:hypothetical protein